MLHYLFIANRLFSNINVSQGINAATYARCGGIFNELYNENSPGNLPVKIFFANRLRFDRITAMSLWPRFLGAPCISQSLCICRTKLERLHKRHGQSRSLKSANIWGNAR